MSRQLAAHFICKGTRFRCFSTGFIRNVGIISHVDAGKTTVTERMLYYSGELRRMGEVHHGDTTMDFMKMERERGITIGAACISFKWKEHCVNLIDTPGHIDFTAEVERSVSALDGAVTIIDGVAGVQAQTETVWKQAESYEVPRIVFVNKLDREGASVDNAIQSLRSRLGVNNIAAIQISCGGVSGDVIDLINMQRLSWSDELGNNVTSEDLSVSDSKAVRLVAEVARTALLEQVAELDSAFMEHYLERNGDVLPSALVAAIRRLVCANALIPLLCGSALKNRGIQPVLDAVCSFLPSPLDEVCWPRTLESGTRVNLALLKPHQLLAIAFKVVHDEKRGLIVYIRVYAGKLKQGERLRAAGSEIGSGERVMRLMEIDADSFRDIREVDAGSVAAIVGLRNVSTGDTIVRDREKNLPKLRGMRKFSAVFFRTAEADSASEEAKLEDALGLLQREDPSVEVTRGFDEQILVGGMGELHLEVVLDRLLNHYNVSVQFGSPHIAYRASIASSMSRTSFETTVRTADGTYNARVSLSAESAPGERVQTTIGDAIKNVATRDAVKVGVERGCLQGVAPGMPIDALHVTVYSVQLLDATGQPSEPASADSNLVTGAVSNALLQAMKLSQSLVVLEPIMHVEITLGDVQYYGSVLSDLSSQRSAQIEASSQSQRVITAACPLQRMLGYATAVRSLTKGTATFTMEFKRYAPASNAEEVLKSYHIIKSSN